MRIVSWNVAGLRACLKQRPGLIAQGKYDMVCPRDKSTESEVELPEEIMKTFLGTEQPTMDKGRRGARKDSADRHMALGKHLKPPFDIEGRVTVIGFRGRDLSR